MTSGIALAQDLQAARPDDVAAVHRMFERCSAATRHGRFHGLLQASVRLLAGSPPLPWRAP